MSQVPWNSHEEYVALHDLRPCSIAFGTVRPVKCPEERYLCDGLTKTCPRFGGAEPDENGNEFVLCRNLERWPEEVE